MAQSISNSRKFFLVIEGLDGSGKSEISRQLANLLRETVEYVKLTFEPHDPSAAGLFIRQVLTKRIKASAETLALAFALNRLNHIEDIINPFLAGPGDRIVVCDRYYLSSLVYQSTSTISMHEIMEFNRYAKRPDLTIFLDASTSTCYERIGSRSANKELFETNLVSSRRKYYDAIEYLQNRGENIISVNADGTIEDVLNSIIDILYKNGLDWLNIQRPLLSVENSPFDFTQVDQEAELTKVGELIHQRTFQLRNGNNRITLRNVEVAVEQVVAEMSIVQLSGLFLSYVKSQNYQVGEPLPWTDVLAYEMDYKMPMGLLQQGTAIVMREKQRYDTITKKIQELELRAKEIDRTSDFIIVLDPSPASAEAFQQYRREVTTRITASTSIIGRREIADYLLSKIRNSDWLSDLSTDSLVRELFHSPNSLVFKGNSL